MRCRQRQPRRTATDQQLVAKIGFVPGTLDVPSGVQGALERRFAEAGIPAITLWARVPHYVAGMPYPAASAGSNLGGRKLDDSTVLDDVYVDVLRGGGSNDAFFVQTTAGVGIVKDMVTDKGSSESVIDVQ